MTVCAISLRQLDTRPVDHSTAPKAEVAYIAYVSQTPTTNSFFSSPAFHDLDTHWGERIQGRFYVGTGTPT
jgi:hypothetical protein